MGYFRNEDKVEVKTLGVWFPATVLQSPPATRRNGLIYLSYDTLFEETPANSRLRAFADVADVRPAQPPERNPFYRVGEEVEVLTGAEERGWRKGCVRGILENSKYLVEVSGDSDGDGESSDGNGEISGGDDTLEVDHWGLRPYRVWADGSWVPPFLHEEHSQELPRKPIRSLRIKCSAFHKLVKGMKVEVMRQSEGVQEEVWYPAIIIKPLQDERFLVGYLTLRSEEGSQYVMEEVGVLNIRPSPPIVFLGMPVGLEQVDGWYNGGWWVGYVSRVIAGSKYMVCLRNSGEETVFEHHKLRPHQDWDIKGNWNPAPKVSSNQAETSSGPIKLKIKGLEETFIEGMMVEVRTDEDGFSGSLFVAKILNYIGGGKYMVQYQTLKANGRKQLLREVVAGTRLRPCPPKMEKYDYKVLEEVDAWHGKGWWVGLISRFVGVSEYAVYFWTTNEEFQYGCEELRPHHDWTCGKWTTAPTPKKLSSKMPKRDYNVGMLVEVKSHAYGFVGAWYSVKVVSCLHKDKYVVEYETLKTGDDDSSFLQETVDGYQIRPRPPPIEKRGCYKLLEVVDVWYQEGWWVGLITRLLGTSKYSVYFWTSNDAMNIHSRDLRRHQAWSDGNWTIPIKMSNSLMKSKLGKLGRKEGLPKFGACFCYKAKVEVCSIEKGFHDVWYPAVILRSMGDGKYLVRYQTVTRDDETQLLEQEADGSCIRPTPPIFLQEDPFKALERVDAWYREGWCVGHIQKVTAESNYLVHVNTTSEVVEFQYAYLRPHQDWLYPEWKSYTKGRALERDAEA